MALLYVFYQRPELMGVEGKKSCKTLMGREQPAYDLHVLRAE
ncbi:hypothetical protein O9993_07620 [Vibrio lentus]|nr:hypothetical protein [Vibrio lentus]